MTTVPAIRAGAAAGMPVVATVRDYWPVCYWSDLIYDPSAAGALPGLHGDDDDAVRAAARGRGVAGGVVADSVHAREPRARSGATLARADAVIAVEPRHRRRPAAPRAGTGADAALHDSQSRRHDARSTRSHRPSPRPLAEPYVLYVGQARARTRACSSCCDAVRATPASRGRSSSSATGRCAPTLEAEARARAASTCACSGWLDRATTLDVDAARRRCWRFRRTDPESLSRVLIEAVGARRADRRDGHRRHARHHRSPASPACSRPIAAGFSRDLRAARVRRRGCARRSAPRRATMRIARFAAPSVVERVEQVYRGAAAAARRVMRMSPRRCASPSSPAPSCRCTASAASSDRSTTWCGIWRRAASTSR